MLEYNTRQKFLILPEYGRTIHKMVEYCKQLPSRGERNYCAAEIIEAMQKISPSAKEGDEENRLRKLWDHLAMMAEFNLDIDYPFDIVKPEELMSEAHTLALPPKGIDNPRRHYGRHIPAAIEEASRLELGAERDYLVHLIANQMKKALLSIDGVDSVDDRRICADLAVMSHGVFRISPEEICLNDYNVTKTLSKKKKKK